MNIGAMKTITSQHWNTWFHTPVPMLNNQTPIVASKTEAGRKLIKELLFFYERTAVRPVDVNIPTRYAIWKLGIGPGTSKEFVREEATFNFKDSQHPPKRKERHTNRLIKKVAIILVPKRCEMLGCDKKESGDVQICGHCKCVFYCGREHQKQDWVRHRLDCNVVANLEVNLQPKPFFWTKERSKYPLGCLKSPIRGDCCFICHSRDPITYTDCCGLPICDDSYEFATSRDSCHRSHMLYTACATHHEEGHEGDWRECDDCNKLIYGARPFSSTNGFCVTPCIEKFLPQGSMLTYPCEMPGCKNRMLSGHSAATYNGGKNGGRSFCAGCTF
jgi:hypothetical protein